MSYPLDPIRREHLSPPSQVSAPVYATPSSENGPSYTPGPQQPVLSPANVRQRLSQLNPEHAYQLSFIPRTTKAGLAYEPVITPATGATHRPLCQHQDCHSHPFPEKPKPPFKDFILDNKIAALVTLLILIIIAIIAVLVLVVFDVGEI